MPTASKTSTRSKTKGNTKAGASSFKIGKPAKADSVEFLKSSPNGTKYEELLSAMENLKVGEVLPVDVPSGIDAKTFHNRLNSVIARYAPETPEGYRFVKRTTQDETQVCILLREVSDE